MASLKGKHVIYRRYVKKVLYNSIKRCADIVFCIVATVALSPLFIIVGIGIKLSSKGPVLYHSVRAGKDKVPFEFYKFRSMHQSDKDKELFIADADRLFPFGSFIRRTKIDELPQLINVIKGDMSIVGPRPMPISSVDTIYCGRYAQVLSIRPGLTSPASLFDYTVGDTYTDDLAYRKEVLPIKLEMERIYIDRQSLVYDMCLILRTIRIIVMKALGKRDFSKQAECFSIEKERT